MTDEEFVKALSEMTPQELEPVQRWIIQQNYAMTPARDGRPLNVDQNVLPEPTSRPLHEAERIRRLGPFAPPSTNWRIKNR